MLWKVNKRTQTLFVKSRLSRGAVTFQKGFPGNFLKMVNFEMSRRYRESNFNPICTCTECYLYSSITQNGGAIIPQITLKAAKHFAFQLIVDQLFNWSLYISLKG